MSLPQENDAALSLVPTPPLPLDKEQLEFVETELLALKRHEMPIAAMMVDHNDAYLMLLDLAETDPNALDQLEAKMRIAMAEEGGVDRATKKFTLQSVRVQVRQRIKDRDRELRQLAKNHSKRRQQNEALTQAGRPNELAQQMMEMSPTVASDHGSSSMPLIAHAWLINNRHGRIWYDEFSAKIMSDYDGGVDTRIKAARINNRWISKAWFVFMRADKRLEKISAKQTLAVAEGFAYEDIRNAPRDWLKTLRWDNTPRLKTWLHKTYSTPQDDYHAAVGRCWIVSMVARMVRPGSKVHTMPVLIGPEGVRKSTSLEILGGDWYGSISTSAEKTADFFMALQGKAVAEIPELDALINKKVEFGRVKMILSQSDDDFRVPYGHVNDVSPRTCVLVGTTNDWHWFADQGIGRRFWPFICNVQIDEDWLTANRDQLFAEAFWLYQQNPTDRKVREGDPGCWWDVPKQAAMDAVQNHHIADEMESAVESWLASTPGLFTHAGCGVKPTMPSTNGDTMQTDPGTVITTNRICLGVLGTTSVVTSAGQVKRITQAMHKLGFDKRSTRCTNGSTPKAWRKDVETRQLFEDIE